MITIQSVVINDEELETSAGINRICNKISEKEASLELLFRNQIKTFEILERREWTTRKHIKQAICARSKDDQHRQSIASAQRG